MSRKKSAAKPGRKKTPGRGAKSRKAGSSRRAATGQRTGRKNTARKASGGRGSRRKTRPRRRWFGRLALLACGLLIGLLGPWLLWLNHLVTSEFEGRLWDLPSRVYARPLSLYPGLRISPEALQTELEAAGYRRLPEATSGGTYARGGGRFEIHRRAFRFEDGVQEAIRFTVRIEGGAVSRLEAPARSTPLNLVRLDPAEFASIYPSRAEDRTLVALEDVPELLVTGLQAVEDRRFKQHPGVDLRGIGRALVANLRARATVQGGSTLTQQLVKNYYLDDERTLPRKVNEAFMALLLEWHYGKAEILEAYINEVYLGQQGGRAIHGFGRASEYYFGRPLVELEPHQIALLVGMVRGASLYNPRRNPARALDRRNRVLDQFEETGLLTGAEASGWRARPLDVTPEPGVGRNRYAAFVDLVRDQLARDYDAEELRTEGLRIFTTLAPSAQEAGQRALSEGLDDLARRGLPEDLQGAIVLAEADSGEIRALIGDRWPLRRGFNRALNARRQVGSVIKPLVYLLALEHQADYHWLTPVEDRPVSLIQPDGTRWTPANHDGRSHGTVSLLEALTGSYNQATVRLGMTLGVRQLIDRLRRLGVQSDIPAVPSTLLGAVELTPLEVAQVYQSLASGGFSVPLRAVTAVQTPDGRNLNRYPLRYLPLERREAVAVLNYGLTRVVAEGTAAELPRLLGKEVLVAGKTGTTNERRDSWFVGYTRDLVGVAWVGLDDNRPAGVTGSNAAMRIWAGLFRSLPLEPVSQDLPEEAHWLWVRRDPALRSAAGCAGAEQMPFVIGSEPESLDECAADKERGPRESLWKKWFGND